MSRTPDTEQMLPAILPPEKQNDRKRHGREKVLLRLEDWV